jgi:cysteine desulfurase / selenocysteine lyase
LARGLGRLRGRLDERHDRGINLVAASWGGANLRSGDEILLTELEHHSNIVPWQLVAERTGARLRYVPIDDEGRLVLEQPRPTFSRMAR